MAHQALQAEESRASFFSLLFARADDTASIEQRGAPAFFRALNLDQVIESITAGREEYELKSFFYRPLRDVNTVNYRHEVLHDLEVKAVSERIRSFAQKMRSMREHLALVRKLRHTHQKEAWFLGAVEVYGDAVRSLNDDLTGLEIHSRALRGLREYLARYVRSQAFSSLTTEATEVKAALAGVSYRLLVQADRITVAKYESEPDYAADVLATFQKFQRGAAEDHRVKFRDDSDMDQVETGVLDRVALLFPDVFGRLGEYCSRYRDYLDPTVAAFDREVQFYLACLEYVERFKPAALSFCYPRLADRSKEISIRETFDIALADKLVPKGLAVVTNDLNLRDPERIIVVTGPNQGGKTTFARTFGQLHYLASIGFLVPGKDATLVMCDRLFTHFEQEEKLADLRGKLEDDLVRIRDILDQATPRSIVILNEIFTSTTLRDSIFLSSKVMERIVQLDLLCVWVTFVDELASMGETTVSMVSTVRLEDPAVRTFKILRRPADGRAYADAIAAKYSLSYERLKERLRRESIPAS